MSDEARPRILCVDDEPPLLDGLRRTLGDAFDVVVASSGPEGLDRLGEGQFDAILSDMRMPGQDGAQFLAEAGTRRRPVRKASAP